MTFSGPYSMGTRRWTCPLCDKNFSKEHEMDMHMITDCPYQNPVGVRGRAGSNSDLSPRKKSTQLTGGNLAGKQSVILTWMKEIDTCEREIFFFHKSGDMFQLIQPQRQSSSLSLANNPKFECKCDLEIGEHEGSLNIGDSGVYEISPFSIKNQPKPVTVVLKTLIHKAKSDQVKGQKSEVSSQSTTSKQTTNEIVRYQTEIRTLQREYDNERKAFLQREEISKQEINKLENEIVEKDKIITFSKETVHNLEVELGRYSEKTQEMMDKLGEDNSKYEGFDKELERMRRELEQRTNELISLQKEKQDMQEKYQNEISNSNLCVESLNKECSLLKIELEKKGGDSKHNFTTKSADSQERIQSLTTRIRELEGTLTTKDTCISHLYAELENIQIHYSNLEKKLQSSKSVNQPSNRDEAQHLYSNTNSQKIPDTRISQLKTKVNDLEMQLTLKNSECEDLQKRIASLQSELKEAQDLLAYKLESLSGSGESMVESVHLSLPPGYKRKDYSYKTSQSTDVDDVRIPKKQIEELEADKQDLKHTVSRLQNHIDSKETENAILRNNLDDSRKELEKTKFQSQHTQQSNPTKVQPKEDLQTGIVVKEKQAQYSQVVTKHKQQRKYNITDLRVNGEYSHFYTLNQVDDPSDFIGELVVCRSKSNLEFVIGTLKVIVPPKFKHDKTIAGIEFFDKFGDCYGSYVGISYFKTRSKCALFIPIAEVYIGYNQSPK